MKNDKNKKLKIIKVVFLVLIIVGAVAMIGWKVGYGKVHENDCCPSYAVRSENCDKSLSIEEKISECIGESMSLSVCSKCEKPEYDNLIYYLAAGEGVFVLAFIVTLIVAKRQ